MSETLPPQPQDDHCEEFSGRRISDSLDLEAIERVTGSAPVRVDAGTTERMIASHWVKIDQMATKPSIIARVGRRMSEHCDLVRVQHELSANYEVVFCPERQEFFACQNFIRIKEPPGG